jgi:hypothetical protein
MSAIRKAFFFAATAGVFALPHIATGQSSATICNDGSTTASAGRGTCSGHGGIDRKATSAASKKTRAPSQVTCTDGTVSKAGRGACSHHGGVQGSAPTSAPRRVPSLPASVPANSPARTRSQANSHAPSATQPSSRRGEDNDPTDAMALCKDGMYSHAANHRGACSKHGGVAKFLKP